MTLAGVGRGQRCQLGLVWVDLEQRDVGGEVSADDLGVDQRALVEADLHLARIGHDVCVRGDVAVVVDHEAAARRDPLLRLRRSKRRPTLLSDPRLDEDHAGAGAFEDLVDPPGVLLPERRRDPRAAGVVAAAVEDPDQGEDADDREGGKSP